MLNNLRGIMLLAFLFLVLTGCSQETLTKPLNQQDIITQATLKLSKKDYTGTLSLVRKDVEDYIHSHYGDAQLYNIKPDMPKSMQQLYDIYCYVKTIELEKNQNYPEALQSISYIDSIGDVITSADVTNVRTRIETQIKNEEKEKAERAEKEKKKHEEQVEKEAEKEGSDDVESQQNSYEEEIKLEPEIGMTSEEVLNSTWGRPKDINRTRTEYGTHEQWVYNIGKYIYLDDGIVTTIQD